MTRNTHERAVDAQTSRPFHFAGRILIDEIVVRDRHRRDFGDLDALAKSIEAEGLLQPIGTTNDKRLVFGERRLRACRLLGWREIDARVVKVTSIVAGEYAENEVRKDFTPSERVAIADAVAAEMGERRGRPSGKKVDHGPPLPSGKTRDLVARKAGFASGKQLDRAKAVVDKAAAPVREAMDKGDVSISAASTIAKAPPADQVAIVALDPKKRREAVRELRQTEMRQAARDIAAEDGASPQTAFVEKHGRLPNEQEARKLAQLTGISTLSSRRVYESPLPPDELAEAQRKDGYVDTLISALDELLSIEAAPADIPACAFDFDAPVITDRVKRALAFLNTFAEEWTRHVAKTAH